MTLSGITAFDFGREVCARLTHCSTQLTSGLVSTRLEFKLGLNLSPPQRRVPTDPEPHYLSDLQGDLYLVRAGVQRLLGRLIPASDQVRLPTRPMLIDYVLQLDLGERDMWRLVEATSGSDLSLMLRLSPRFGPYGDVTGPYHVNGVVPHSEWIKLLDSCNLARFETITLRTPPRSSATFPAYDESLRLLKQAEAAFERSDFNAVGTKCRAAYKHLLAASVNPGGKQTLERLLEAIIDDPRRAKFTRPFVKFAHELFNEATHLEGGPGEPSVQLRREDALLCLHFCSAIISYLADVEIAKAAGGT